MAKRSLGMVVIGFLLLGSCTTSDNGSVVSKASPSATQSEPVETFADDARQALELYTSAHPKPFFASTRAELASTYAGLEGAPATMERSEFLVELMRATARPGRLGGRDGHSGVFPLDDHYPELHLYPLLLYWFEEGLFVTQSLHEGRDLVGTELVAIDGVPIGRIIESVEPLVARDNAMTMRARLPQFLLTQEVLEGLGHITEQETKFSFRWGDERFDRKLAPMPAGDYAQGANIFHPMVPAFLPRRDRPLYLAHRQRDLFLTYLEGSDAAYLQYNVTLQDTDHIADQVAALYRKRTPAKVIVDVRHNPGGDNTTYGELLRTLTTGPIANNTQVYVLVGRGTFSAAGNFVVDLAQSLDVTVIGERSGFAPNQFGDPTSATLASSGLKVNAATVEWIKTQRNDPRLWLEPDIRVGVTAADFFAGRDPVLDKALTD